MLLVGGWLLPDLLAECAFKQMACQGSEGKGPCKDQDQGHQRQTFLMEIPAASSIDGQLQGQMLQKCTTTQKITVATLTHTFLETRDKKMSSSPGHMKNKKVILITGGNKGIGKAMCKTLLQQHPGIHVLLGSRDVEKGKQAASDIMPTIKSTADFSCITVVQLDVTSDSSVQAAAQLVASFDCKLYGIVNNAGMSGENTSATSRDILNTNYFGPRRVNDAFAPLLVRPGGRIVNVSSVTAPIYLSGCLFSFGPKEKHADLCSQLANPCGIEGGVKELDNLANRDALNLCKPTLGRTLAAPVVLPKQHAYMLSKAFLNAYTVLHSKEEPGLVINSCCPGCIGTDLAPKRLKFTGTTDEGAVMPVKLLTHDRYTSDNDGEFVIENKARKLDEIPDLKVYPKSFATVFEKFRLQQEEGKKHLVLKEKSRCSGHYTLATRSFLLFCVTVICVEIFVSPFK
jgi:carbonyl reductase 1